MNISNINRLNNEYRALRNQAEAVYVENGMVHSNEEGLCYQKAANIAGQLASMNIGAESNHWVEEQQKCQQQMRLIWNALHPGKPLKTAGSGSASASDDTEENAGEEGKGTSESSGKPKTAKNTAGKTSPDGIKQEMVDSWFKDDPGYGFEAVVGMEDVIQTLKSCVRDDKMRALVEFLGLPTVQSFFFYGPPGCGKTFVIEAFVHELMQQGYKYMSLASADIHSKFSGEADKILKRVFKEAVDNAPCILFMDEIDGVAQSRELPNLSDFNMQLTTTFLTSFGELVKADREHKSVIFIAATNYPSNVDTAMLDRMELIPIPMPDDSVREQVLRKGLEKMIDVDDTISWPEISALTEGCSQRDLKRLIQKLLMLVFQRVSDCVGQDEGAAEKGVDLLKRKDFRLTREMVDEVFGAYKPKPNADIERSLNEFEAKT